MIRPSPIAEAKRRLEQAADLTPKDFGPMIEAGRRMRWTSAMIRANEELSARGNCYDYTLSTEPYLTGSLFEDNIYFSLAGDERMALKYIERLARELGVRVYRH
jgi:hypothetical protein